MRYTLLLTLALFFTACTPVTLKDSPTTNSSVTESLPITAHESQSVVVASPQAPSLPVTAQETDDNDLKVTDEESLVGNYTLKRGLFGTQEISDGYLVIEELDVNNYGYYYVTVSGNFSPETHTGIFYNKDGKYVQKIIEDSSEAEIQAGKNKYKMSFIDNLSIKQEDNLLALRINSDKHEKLFWVRDVDGVEKSEKMKKNLQEAAYEYQKYYKEKYQENENFSEKAAYTKVND